jgi:serine phosphatase RsbU (regulator of sigma subunit)
VTGYAADAAHYRSVFAASPVAGLLLDTDLVITDATDSYLQMVDRARPYVVGRYVFDAFPDVSGRDEQGALGASMRRVLATGRPDRLPLLDYAVETDGAAAGYQDRWWSVVNIPLLGADGRTTGLLNAVEDVTRIVVEERRSRLARAAAEDLLRQSRALSEDLAARSLDLSEVRLAEARSSRRLAALGEVALELAGAESLEQLTGIVVGHGVAALGADGGAVGVVDASGTRLRLDITDSLGAATQGRYSDLPMDSGLPATVAARTGRPVLLRDRAAGLAFSAEMTQVYEMTGKEAWAAVPLRLGTATLGSVTVSWDAPQVFSPGDVALLNAFAAQCAQTLDRLLRRQAERRSAAASRQMSEALQRSLLGTPVQPDHLQITARYVPAARGVQVGGDWYDAFQVSDGSTQLVVGDVSGHDREAAAAMAQVRNVLRGIAHQLAGPPAAVLTALDAALHDLAVGSLVTAVLAKVEQPEEQARAGLRTLRWSNAGHPPPLLLTPDGAAELLVRPVDLLLGIRPDRQRHDHSHVLVPGSTVLLYTDGLVERRGSTLDEGTELLRSTAGRLAAGDLPLDELCDALLAELGGDVEDDVALLALRAHPEDRPRPAEAGPAVLPADLRGDGPTDG